MLPLRIRTSSTQVAAWHGATAALLCLLAPSLAYAAEVDSRSLSDAYQREVRPLLEQYCYDCHGTADYVEGEVNLAALTNWDEAARRPDLWEQAAEVLASGVMPPEDMQQPTDAERARMQQWATDFLHLEARARAGDPGQVVLRRLSNAEYTYTLRDLTGVDSLDPVREFPVDGAAGEGFTNTGSALVMSPTLVTKYLDAAKELAAHAVLLPDGFRFSPHTTARDWTDDTLAEIQRFYASFTDSGGGHLVNLQGVVFDTNQGGLLPVEKYLHATLADREALEAGRVTVEAVAQQRNLNARYLATLWQCLAGKPSSRLLDDLRARWRVSQPEDAALLAAEVAAWQQALWKFNNVGHLGRQGGPDRWLEPVDATATSQELVLALPDAPEGGDFVVRLSAADAGDGNEDDVVIWQAPRLVRAGEPDLLLRDLQEATRNIQMRRSRFFAQTEAYLAAAAEASSSRGSFDAASLAQKHGVDERGLRAWLDYLNIGSGEPVQLPEPFSTKVTGGGGFDFVNGWSHSDGASLLANSSDQHVRIPGNLKPHSVAVHPWPAMRAAVGWRSPIAGKIRVEATVASAHPECGNGIVWRLEVRRGATRRRLADGVAQGAAVEQIKPVPDLEVVPGDVLVLSIGPRDGNHSCDLTAVDLTIASTTAGDARTWDLAADVSGDVLAGNPHADKHGHDAVWHFFGEPDSLPPQFAGVPEGSVLARWTAATEPQQRRSLATQVQELLTGNPPADDAADAVLYRQLASMRGPLLSRLSSDPGGAQLEGAEPQQTYGLSPESFGRHPRGLRVDAHDLCVQAPSEIVIRLPADLAAGRQLSVSGRLDTNGASKGSVQLAVSLDSPSDSSPQPVAGAAPSVDGSTPSPQALDKSRPILVAEGGAAQQQWRVAFDEFRQLFPPALCYKKIVPVDEVISLTLYHREDDHLARLMLDDSQRRQLDRLWDELHYVSRSPLATVDAFEQLMEYATQDGDPTLFASMKQPIDDRAAEFRRLLLASESKHLEALVDFASRAYRRPLTSDESQDLQSLYEGLRREEIPHDEAFRLTLTRVLVAPAFLYRIEQPVAGSGQGPVTDWELASRLSYFLWASQPDAELRELAASGQLRQPEVLLAQARRMLGDAKIRRLATEFACQWLQINDFQHLDEKSERHFPTFTGLRGAMSEESILFFTDLFQNDGSVLDILDADYTFLNEPLAQHYGVPGVTGEHWRRVVGVKKFHRGGVLALAATLAKHSGASRTSPILRGVWVSEVLLGERLPNPPQGVPPLPDDEAAGEGLTVRELVEKHVSDPKCAVCHRRIDPYGFSLEAFDAIGRFRERDVGGHDIDTKAQVMDGTEFDGLAGLQNYLLTERRDPFVRQFCRKLAGYALGRKIELSDQSLLDDMQRALAANDYRVTAAVEAILLSPQFGQIRGVDSPYNK